MIKLNWFISKSILDYKKEILFQRGRPPIFQLTHIFEVWYIICSSIFVEFRTSIHSGYKHFEMAEWINFEQARTRVAGTTSLCFSFANRLKNWMVLLNRCSGSSVGFSFLHFDPLDSLSTQPWWNFLIMPQFQSKVTNSW